MVDIIVILEQVAALIGETVDSTWEALMLAMFYSSAQQYAAELSEFARMVFGIVVETESSV